MCSKYQKLWKYCLYERQVGNPFPKTLILESAALTPWEDFAALKEYKSLSKPQQAVNLLLEE